MSAIASCTRVMCEVSCDDRKLTFHRKGALYYSRKPASGLFPHSITLTKGRNHAPASHDSFCVKVMGMLLTITLMYNGLTSNKHSLIEMHKLHKKKRENLLLIYYLSFITVGITRPWPEMHQLGLCRRRERPRYTSSNTESLRNPKMSL